MSYITARIAFFTVLCITVACSNELPGESEADFLKIAEGSNRSKRNADSSVLYNSDLFEGDIKEKNIETEGDDEREDSSERGWQRNAVRNRRLLWPNGRVPYRISGEFSYDEKARITEAIREFNSKTCVKFVEKSGYGNGDFVEIIPQTGCWSYVGRNERVTEIDYGTVDNFKRYEQDDITHLGTSYDYNSLMHYEENAFGKNGRTTIIPKQRGVQIGQREGLSRNDILKIKKLYNCDGDDGGDNDGDDGSDGDDGGPTQAPPSGCTCDNRCRQHGHLGGICGGGSICFCKSKPLFGCNCDFSCRLQGHTTGVCGDGFTCICGDSRDYNAPGCSCDTQCRLMGHPAGGICGDGFLCLCSTWMLIL